MQPHTIPWERGTVSISVANRPREVKITVEQKGSTLTHEPTALLSKCMPVAFHPYFLLSGVLETGVPWMSLFSNAAVTNHRTFSDLEQYKFLPQSPEYKISLAGLKLKCWQSWLLLEAVRGESVSLLYQHLEVTCVPCLSPLPHFNLLLLSLHILLLALTLLPSSCKDTCNYTGPIWIIKTALPCWVTYSQVPGSKTRTVLWAIIQPITLDMSSENGT